MLISLLKELIIRKSKEPKSLNENILTEDFIEQIDSLASNGQLDRAISLVERQVEKFNNSIDLLIMYSKLLKQAGLLSKVEQVYERIISLRPNSPEILINLSSIRLSSGDLTGAKKSAERAIDISENFHQAYHNLALACSRLDLKTEAIQHYQRALDIEPNFLPSVINLGHLYEASNRLKEAEYLLTRGESLDPGNPTLVFLEAKIKYRGHDLVAAREILEKANWENQSEHWLSERYYFLGKLNDRLGNYDLAGRQFIQANQLREISISRQNDKTQFVKRIQ